MGRVKSLCQTRPRILRPGMVSKGYERGLGYLSVCLYADSCDRSAKMNSVHRLVLESFIGLPPDGMEASHINGVKTDNRLENLEWATFSDNNMKKHEHGTIMNGSKVPNAKLREGDIKAIIEMISSGVSDSEIGKLYGVHRHTVNDIRNNKTWRHAHV
jgi:hypothetical protein